MTLVECCDLCKEPMLNYTDENGRYWEGISFRSKKYKRRFFDITGSSTEYLSICGRCRAEIAKRRREE